MSRDEPTNFLYPFIDAEEDNAASLLADLPRLRGPKQPRAWHCGARRCR